MPVRGGSKYSRTRLRRAVRRARRTTFMGRHYKKYIRPKGFFKLRAAIDLAANSGGTINTVFTMTGLSGSLYTVDGGAASGSVEEISTVGQLYDQYKVRSVQIKYIPSLPNDTSTITGFFPLYTVVDHDTPNTSAVVTSIATAIQYDNLKVFNLYRPWKRYIKVPRYTVAGVPAGWLDLANVVNYGSIILYGTGYDISQTYGKLVLTYYVATKNRR